MLTMAELVRRSRALLRNIRDSIFRTGLRPSSDRERSQAVFENVFLHIQSVRTHRNSLRFTYSFGLGVILTACFILLTITGILLMVYYKPSTDLAYNSIKDIHFVVPAGRLVRNIHRWAAHVMVVAAFLHMARVFYSGAYKPPREFNWLVGLALLVLTLALSFTGYLLPWDQLAYWATTIGVNIASSPREVTDSLGITAYFDPGGLIKELLLGANHVGQETLIRFYVLHVVALPLVMAIFMAVHFWRIHKDGGLSREETGAAEPAELGGRKIAVFEPAPTKTYGLMAIVRGRKPVVGRAPEATLPSWPHLLWAEAALFMLTTAATVALAYFFDAPLREPANPDLPENPAKAPWYFLGLQELVSYSAFMGGVGVPLLALVGLGLIPYVDRDPAGVGKWFGGREGKVVFWQSIAFGLSSVIGALAFLVNFGWLRDWFPEIPQLIITLINPGTLIVAAYVWFSLRVLRRRRNIRLSAIALFTCFLCGFVALTVMGSVFRGPNWEFYWWPTQWPGH